MNVVAGALSGADANNYTLTSSNTSTTASITAKSITATGVTAQNKTYDGNTSATISGGTLNGVIVGDTVNLASNGSFTDKNVGTGKTVNISNSLSGTDANNYTLTSGNTTITADIAAKGITGTITAANKVYDGNTVASTSGILSGVVAGDTVTLTSTGDFTDKNAATGKTVNVTAGTLLGLSLIHI